MRKQITLLTLLILIAPVCLADNPEYRTLWLYHTSSHESLGYNILQCDGRLTGKGASGPYDHTHIEYIDPCNSYITLDVVEEVTKLCIETYQTIDNVQACIRDQIQQFNDENSGASEKN